MVRLAAQHDAIDMGQVGIDVGDGLDAAVEDDFEVRKFALETMCVLVSERWNLAVFLWTETLEDRRAGMHDEGPAAGIGHRAHEVAHEAVLVMIVDADAMLDGDIDRDGVAHRLDAVRHQRRLRHQAGAECALLHPL